MLQNKCTKLRAACAACALFSSLNKSESHWLNEDKNRAARAAHTLENFFAARYKKKKGTWFHNCQSLPLKDSVLTHIIQYMNKTKSSRT